MAPKKAGKGAKGKGKEVEKPVVPDCPPLPVPARISRLFEEDQAAERNILVQWPETAPPGTKLQWRPHQPGVSPAPPWQEADAIGADPQKVAGVLPGHQCVQVGPLDAVAVEYRLACKPPEPPSRVNCANSAICGPVLTCVDAPRKPHCEVVVSDVAPPVVKVQAARANHLEQPLSRCQLRYRCVRVLLPDDVQAKAAALLHGDWERGPVLRAPQQQDPVTLRFQNAPHGTVLRFSVRWMVGRRWSSWSPESEDVTLVLPAPTPPLARPASPSQEEPPPLPLAVSEVGEASLKLTWQPYAVTHPLSVLEYRICVCLLPGLVERRLIDGDEALAISRSPNTYIQQVLIAGKDEVVERVVSGLTPEGSYAVLVDARYPYVGGREWAGLQGVLLRTPCAEQPAPQAPVQVPDDLLEACGRPVPPGHVALRLDATDRYELEVAPSKVPSSSPIPHDLEWLTPSCEPLELKAPLAGQGEQWRMVVVPAPREGLVARMRVIDKAPVAPLLWRGHLSQRLVPQVPPPHPPVCRVHVEDASLTATFVSVRSSARTLSCGQLLEPEEADHVPVVVTRAQLRVRVEDQPWQHLDPLLVDTESDPRGMLRSRLFRADGLQLGKRHHLQVRAGTWLKWSDWSDATSIRFALPEPAKATATFVADPTCVRVQFPSWRKLMRHLPALDYTLVAENASECLMLRVSDRVEDRPEVRRAKTDLSTRQRRSTVLSQQLWGQAPDVSLAGKAAIDPETGEKRRRSSFPKDMNLGGLLDGRKKRQSMVGALDLQANGELPLVEQLDVQLGGLLPQQAYRLTLRCAYGALWTTHGPCVMEIGEVQTGEGDLPLAAPQALSLGEDEHAGSRQVCCRTTFDPLYALEYRLAQPPGGPVHWYDAGCTDDGGGTRHNPWLPLPEQLEPASPQTWDVVEVRRCAQDRCLVHCSAWASSVSAPLPTAIATCKSPKLKKVLFDAQWHVRVSFRVFTKHAPPMEPPLRLSQVPNGFDSSDDSEGELDEEPEFDLPCGYAHRVVTRCQLRFIDPEQPDLGWCENPAERLHPGRNGRCDIHVAVENFQEHARYSFQVRLGTEDRWSGWSGSSRLCRIAVPPPRPQGGLTVEQYPKAPGVALLHWQPFALDKSLKDVQYRLTARPVIDGEAQEGFPCGPHARELLYTCQGGPCSHEISGLWPNVEYEFCVGARYPYIGIREFRCAEPQRMVLAPRFTLLPAPALRFREDGVGLALDSFGPSGPEVHARYALEARTRSSGWREIAYEAPELDCTVQGLGEEPVQLRLVERSFREAPCLNWRSAPTGWTKSALPRPTCAARVQSRNQLLSLAVEAEAQIAGAALRVEYRYRYALKVDLPWSEWQCGPALGTLAPADLPLAPGDVWREGMFYEVACRAGLGLTWSRWSEATRPLKLALGPPQPCRPDQDQLQVEVISSTAKVAWPAALAFGELTHVEYQVVARQVLQEEHRRTQSGPLIIALGAKPDERLHKHPLLEATIRDLRCDLDYRFSVLARYPRVGPRVWEEVFSSRRVPMPLRSAACVPLPVQIPIGDAFRRRQDHKNFVLFLYKGAEGQPAPDWRQFQLQGRDASDPKSEWQALVTSEKSFNGVSCVGAEPKFLRGVFRLYGADGACGRSTAPLLTNMERPPPPICRLDFPGRQLTSFAFRLSVRISDGATLRHACRYQVRHTSAINAPWTELAPKLFWHTHEDLEAVDDPCALPLVPADPAGLQRRDWLDITLRRSELQTEQQSFWFSVRLGDLHRWGEWSPGSGAARLAMPALGVPAGVPRDLKASVSDQDVELEWPQLSVDQTVGRSRATVEYLLCVYRLEASRRVLKATFLVVPGEGPLARFVCRDLAPRSFHEAVVHARLARLGSWQPHASCQFATLGGDRVEVRVPGVRGGTVECGFGDTVRLNVQPRLPRTAAGLKHGRGRGLDPQPDLWAKQDGLEATVHELAGVEQQVRDFRAELVPQPPSMPKPREVYPRRVR